MFINHLCNHKLVLIYKLLFVLTDHDELLRFTTQHLERIFQDDPFSTCSGFLGSSFQGAQMHDYGPSEKDWQFWDGIPDPFCGDESGPPFAWTILWEDKYSSIYGGYIKEERREWGYVFWDAARMEPDSSSGARDVLESQWFDIRPPRECFLMRMKDEFYD
jgi:hypothetical protein